MTWETCKQSHPVIFFSKLLTAGPLVAVGQDRGPPSQPDAAGGGRVRLSRTKRCRRARERGRRPESVGFKAEARRGPDTEAALAVLEELFTKVCCAAEEDLLTRAVSQPQATTERVGAADSDGLGGLGPS
jgi:hypothetical protein